MATGLSDEKPEARIKSALFEHDPRHLLRPKKVVVAYKKKFWFGLIWVHFPKIDLWGLFFTQILVPNPVVQSEKRYNEKYRFFQKLRKVAINQLFF